MAGILVEYYTKVASMYHIDVMLIYAGFLSFSLSLPSLRQTEVVRKLEMKHSTRQRGASATKWHLQETRYRKESNN